MAVTFVIAMIVAAAAMIAAGMAAGMFMIVVAAVHIGVEFQLAFDQGQNGVIAIADAAAVELDAHALERHLCAAANAAADHSICTLHQQEGSQRAMAAAHGIHNFGFDDFTVLNVVNFELGGVAEVLEDVIVIIGDCNAHSGFSFFFHA